MRRRHQNGHRQPFPLELLDLPLPLSDADQARVDAARDAAGWSIIEYLRARGARRRRALSGDE